MALTGSHINENAPAPSSRPRQVEDLLIAPILKGSSLIGISAAVVDLHSSQESLRIELSSDSSEKLTAMLNDLTAARTREDVVKIFDAARQAPGFTCKASMPMFVREPIDLSKVLDKANPANFVAPVDRVDSATGLPTRAALADDRFLSSLSERMDLSQGALIVAIDGRGWGIRNTADREVIDSVNRALAYYAGEAFDPISFALFRRAGDEFVLISENPFEGETLAAIQSFLSNLDLEHRDQQKRHDAYLDSIDPSGKKGDEYQAALKRVDYQLSVKEQMKGLQARYEKELVAQGGEQAKDKFSRDGYLEFLDRQASKYESAKEWIGAGSVGALELSIALAEVELNKLQVRAPKSLFSASIAQTPADEILTAELIHRALGLADKQVHQAKREGVALSLENIPIVTEEIKTRDAFRSEKTTLERLAADHAKYIGVLKSADSDFIARAQAVLALKLIEILDPTTSAIHAKKAHDVFLGEYLGFSGGPRMGTSVVAKINNPGALNNAGRDGYEGTDALIEYVTDQLRRVDGLGDVIRTSVGRVQVNKVDRMEIPIIELMELQDRFNEIGRTLMSDRVLVEIERRLSLDAWIEGREIKAQGAEDLGSLISLSADTGATFDPDISLADYFDN